MVDLSVLSNTRASADGFKQLLARLPARGDVSGTEHPTEGSEW